MRRQPLLAFSALVLCLMLAGCGSKPYYKFEGPGDSKKLVVYKSDGNITFDLGAGVGGGLWKYISREDIRAAKGHVEKTIEENGVKFTVTYNPAGVLKVSVKNVYYDGKQLKAW